MGGRAGGGFEDRPERDGRNLRIGDCFAVGRSQIKKAFMESESVMITSCQK